MDSTVSVALEEICSQGVKGLALQTLWTKLHSPLSSQGIHLSDDVKKAIWSNLIAVPGLKFEARKVSYDSLDPAIQNLEASEKLNLTIIPADRLRNNFVGMYDILSSDSGISELQQRVLERLAIARTNGITQSELAKELGVKGNHIFYVLKNLECRGLIVRQSTIMRTKEASSEGGSRNSSVVSTNMLHLYRYAKQLGSQQRLEIIRGDISSAGNDIADRTNEAGDVIPNGCIEDVRIRDFLPALKAICDKLDQADGKVLVVSDIKRDLDYRGKSGHRAWRNICGRLKEARVVEDFCAKVNKKEVMCLRLLKKFSEKNFEPKTVGNGQDDLETEELAKLGKRGQITEQLVELPIEHQIFDMIDAAGSNGLTITEVCRRLGINNKQYYTRLHNMFETYGVHMQAENHNRGVAYRIWTSRHHNPEASKIIPSKSENVTNEFGTHSSHIAHQIDQAFSEISDQTITDSALSACKGEVKETENRATEPEFSQVELTDELPIASTSDKAIEPEVSHRPLSDDLPVASALTVSDAGQSETQPLTLSTPPRPRSHQRYPCQTQTAAGALREQRILQMLQDEKFLVRAELQRKLTDLEMGKKHTLMDRKTLNRVLKKLQEEGLCRIILVSVPLITNCGNSRIRDILLHPSIPNVTPELLGQINVKLRSFDMMVHCQGSPRLKKDQSVPVLDNIPRTTTGLKLDVQAVRSEAMRTNGFVLAKMVRTKLLHIFLWGCLSSTPGWDDAFSFGEHHYDLKNPHSTCKLFALDAAIKSMPLELFLQVVGSTQKFEDMIEKCRTGMRLSDLPKQEYISLMDTQATGRLSLIIDTLRCLKLIRLVRDKHSEDVAEVQHAILTHALELKPYIEEPDLLFIPSSATTSLDFRPQIRHDFILSSRKAVDEYWNTLEFCYSAANSKAALHAFPGSVVHKEFFSRSWASVRVMTADQRAKLFRRIVNDDPHKKISYKECEKIAEDLNLTLEQVLRICYDKRHRRLTNFHGVCNDQGEEPKLQKTRRSTSSRKRTKSLDGRLLKRPKIDSVDEHSDVQVVAKLSHNDDQSAEEQCSYLSDSEEQDSPLKPCQDVHEMESKEETRVNTEADEQNYFIHKYGLPRLKSTREKRFSWTENAERQLVIEYVRSRVALGAKYHRTDWASLPDLPAPPNVCKRRMALLNSNMKFRKAVSRFCNMLSKRYVVHLKKTQGKLFDHNNCGVMVQDSLSEKDCEEDCNRNISAIAGHTELGPEEQWDDFENNDIKIALDEVLRYKWMAKLEASKRGKSVSEEWSNLNMDAEPHDYQETALASSATPGEDIQNHGGEMKVPGGRSSRHRLPQRHIKLLSEGINFSKRVYTSLAVSNASELFKLVFLSTSNAPEVSNLLAETLRRYSELDLLAAFNYLREKRIMVGGSGSSPFALSQQFLQTISSSPFPTNSGKRAARFASWLDEMGKDLLEDAIDLTADLQCGDVFHLCALLSSGELSISPCLPDEGVGEVEDSRAATKRKPDDPEPVNDNMAKKMKSSLPGECEIIIRREKGFPGIRLSISQVTISEINAVELFKNGDFHAGKFLGGEDDYESGNVSFHSDHGKGINVFGSAIPTEKPTIDSPWEAMKSYAEHFMHSPSNQEQGALLNSETFRKVYSAVRKAGDQGLSMTEISQVMNMHGEKVQELVIEVLETFGRVLKVNGHDSIHVVDSLYKSKYFLTSMTVPHQDIKLAPPKKSKGIVDDRHLSIQPENPDVTNQHEKMAMSENEVHKVTILNLPVDGYQPSSETQRSNESENCEPAKLISRQEDCEDDIWEIHSTNSSFCRRILPWINGDGTINNVVYKGLVRRLIGIVMQNPGILEDEIIKRMEVLNPQSCRTLLDLMSLDKHIIVRKMHQTTPVEPPGMLTSLFRSHPGKSKLICREHFFANPMSTSLL